MNQGYWVPETEILFEEPFSYMNSFEKSKIKNFMKFLVKFQISLEQRFWCSSLSQIVISLHWRDAVHCSCQDVMKYQ